jgi:putative aldouronate transport system substrate-binding protein
MRVFHRAGYLPKAGIILGLLLVLALPLYAGSTNEVGGGAPTVKFLFSDRGVTKWTPETFTMAEFAKQMGAKLELIPVPATDMIAKFNSIIAGGDLPDLMSVPDGMNIAKQYGPKGLFYQLDKTFGSMPNLNQLRKDYPNYDLTARAIDGHIYQYLQVTPYNNFNRGAAFSPRLAALGVDARKDIKTMDDLYAALKKLKTADPANYPWVSRTGSWGANLGEAYRMFGTNVTFWLNPETGKFSFGPLEPNFKALVQFMAKAWAEGIMHPDFFSMGEEAWRELMAAGKASFTIDASVTQSTWYGGKQADKSTWWVSILSPELNGKRNGISDAAPNVGVYNAFMVNAKTKSIKNIVKFVDWLYSKEGSEFEHFGTVGVTCERMPDGLLRYLFPAGKTWPNLFTYGDIMAGGLWDWTNILRSMDTNNKYSIVQMGGSAEELAYINEIRAYYVDNKALRPAQPTLVFTDDENDQIKQIKTALDTYAAENAIQFIMGKKPMGEWDAYIAKMKSMNSDQAIAVYQAAYDRYMKK